jgi:hypothetical protein
MPLFADSVNLLKAVIDPLNLPAVMLPPNVAVPFAFTVPLQTGETVVASLAAGGGGAKPDVL